MDPFVVTQTVDWISSSIWFACVFFTFCWFNWQKLCSYDISWQYISACTLMIILSVTLLLYYCFLSHASLLRITRRYLYYTWFIIVFNSLVFPSVACLSDLTCTHVWAVGKHSYQIPIRLLSRLTSSMTGSRIFSSYE